MVSEITDIYVTGFNKMVGDPNFTRMNWRQSQQAMPNYWRKGERW